MSAGTARLPNRWLLLPAAVVLQMTNGAIMAWSVFRNPLIEAFGWTVPEVTLAYTINQLVFGFAAFAGGWWLGRVGPRTVAAVGGAIFSAGLILCSQTDQGLWMLYLGYGVMGGIGRGFSFIIPVAVLVRWFPDHRGLVAGIAAAGYGAGTLVTAPVATQLIAAVGVLWTFALLGLASAIMVAGSAVWLKAPPAGYSRPSRPAERNQRVEPVTRTFTLGEACRTWQCGGLCLLFFVYVSAGHAFISQAAPIAQELVQADAFVAAGLVGGAAIANVAGGLLCPWLSDAIGRRVTLTLLFLLQSLTFTALSLTSTLEVLVIEAALVLFCFGGGFSTMAPLVADYFGAQQVGSLFGLVLIASGFSSLAGPLLLSFLRESTGAFTVPLTVFAVLTLLGSLIPLALRPPTWTPERGLARREPQPGHQAL